MLGGKLITGGLGSATLAGVRLHGLIFNVLNFENGLGWISASANWRSAAPVVFLMGRGHGELRGGAAAHSPGLAVKARSLSLRGSALKRALK